MKKILYTFIIFIISKINVMNIIKFLFGWPLSLAALFFIAKIIVPNIGNLSTSLLHINFFFLFLSLCCFFAYYLLRCFFWQKLLRYKNHALSLRETSYLWSLSEIKRFIPGNIWSFLGRTTAFSAK